MKKYISKSDIAFNLNISGKRKHISFDPLCSGGSVFFTDNEIIQKALEDGPLFGDLYNLEEDFTEAAVEETTTETEELIEVDEIDSLADARDFLIEKGIEANAIRNKVAIISAAKKLGYSFPNLL